ncbi:T9SS type A sorting domain-containing protein [Fluviicola sp.]|uniref:T9SS type A sorting domain-containing protein n=1 Tax=Fluviicola sp. TaxID=1917219 RepID=UPI003D2A985F
MTQTLTQPAAIGSNQTVSICAGESFTVGPFTHTTSGTYNDPLASSTGCDSIVTTVLTVTNINNSVNLSGHQLSAIATGAQYQWLNCGNGYAIVPGETGQTFSPSTDGAYAVSITINNCTDTSSCIVYSTLGFEEALKTTISCSPNPVTDVLQIRTNESIRSVEIIDLFGKKQIVSLKGNELYTNELTNGVYFVHVTTSSGNDSMLRIVKQ